MPLGVGFIAILAPVRIYTKKGDDGTTGLLYGGRISKADPAAELKPSERSTSGQ